MKTISKFAALLAMLALAVAAPAYGQSTTDGYNEAGPAIEGQVDNGTGGGDNAGGVGGQNASGSGNGGGSDPVSTDDGSELPFTGLDLILVAMGGGVLLLAGIGMRQLTRRPQSQP